MASDVSSLPDSFSNEQTNLFKHVLDNLLDGVYFTDRDRRIT